MAYRLISEDQAPETGLQSGIRNIARSGARAAETIADIPRNLANFPAQTIKLLSGGQSPELAKASPEIPERFSPREAITKPLTGQYLEPHTPIEQTTDEFIQDLTGLLVGGTPKKFALAGTAVSNLGKWGSQQIGLPESIGEGIKAGGLLLTSVFGGRNKINNLTNKMYKEVDKIGNQVGKPVNVHGLRDKAFKLERKVSKRSFAGKSTVEKEINELNQLLGHHDAIPFDELWQRKKDISKKIGSEKDPLAKRFLSELSNDTKESILEFGKRHKVPELNRNLIEADDLFAASKAAGPINKFVEKIPGIEKIVTVPWLRNLILPGAGLEIARNVGLPGIAGAAATGYIGHEMNRLFAFLANSPTARKLYADYAQQAAIGNAGKVRSLANKLNQEAEKADKQGTIGRYKLVS